MAGSILAGLFFFWIICGVIGAMIASSRGGNGAGGFCLGVLFGPIGILIACFLGPSQPAQVVQVVQAPSSTPQKKCPECAEWVQPEARICRYCRHEFVEPAAPIEEPKAEPEPKPISYDDVPYGTYDESEGGPGGWVPVLIFILLAAGVLGGVYLLSRPTDPVAASSNNGAATEQSNAFLGNAAMPAQASHRQRRHR